MLTPGPGHWTDLGGGIRIRQSRAYWMNSIVLEHAEHTLVVDPGVLPSELADLTATVAGPGPAAVTMLLTHAHWDHVLGRTAFPAAATFAHPRFAQELADGAARTANEARAVAAEGGEPWPGGFTVYAPERTLADGERVQLGPWVLVARDAPGHCDSQLSIELPERGVLLAADMLSDLEIPLMNRPAATYRRTLDGLRPVLESPRFTLLIPGHGAPAAGADAAARLARDLDYLQTLERQVARAKKDGLSLEATQRQLASMEYTGKHAAYSMVAAHERNVRIEWESGG